MTRKSWILFGIVGFLWGIPYLLMKVAVADIPPALIVAGRTLIGAAILIPIAMKKNTFMDAIRGIKYVAPYAVLEMIGPWILITSAEQEISSGLAGLLVSTVPIFSTITMKKSMKAIAVLNTPSATRADIASTETGLLGHTAIAIGV